MSQELMTMDGSKVLTASLLGVRTLNAAVSVPLVELDQMRAEHAEAIKLAKHLESKQGMIKVVINGNTIQRERQYLQNGAPGEIRENRIPINISTEYFNMDELLDEITAKANTLAIDKLNNQYNHEIKNYQQAAKVNRDALDTKSQENVKQQQTIRDLEDQLSRSKEAVTRLEGDLKYTKNDFSKQIIAKEEQIADLTKLIKEQHQPLLINHEELKEQYAKLEADKSFWGWVKGKNK